jgi:hypothetical protein
MSGYGPPLQVMVGGELRSDGPILLPTLKGRAKTLNQLPGEMIYPAQPLPRPAAPVRPKVPSIQPTSGTTPASEEPLPPDAGYSVGIEAHPPAAPAYPATAEVVAVGEACEPEACLIGFAEHRPPFGPRGYRYYGSAEYLFWWVDTQDAPPLLVVDPAAGPETVIGDGDLDLDNGERTGVRLNFGKWLNSCQTLGLEGTFLYLIERRPTLTATSADGTLLARPFINAANNAASGILLTAPGVVSARSEIEMFHRLWGAEANLRKQLCRFHNGHLDVLAGFRYLQLDEHLAVNDSIQFAVSPAFLSGALITTHDYFGTENQFYGGQLGLQSQFQWGRFNLDLWGKVGLGNNRQSVGINGTTAIVGPPAPVGNVSAVGGVLAQRTNIGQFERDRFAVLPEVGIRVGVRLTDCLRVGAGYSFLYLNNAVRPGDQIDPVVNPTQVPQLFQGPLLGQPRPAFLFRESDYWAHGLNVEFEYRF